MNQMISASLTALNSIGSVFWDYAAAMFVQASLLIVLLWVIDRLLRKRVSATFRYCLWMLVLVKLVLPPMLSLPTGIGYWCPNYLSTASPVSEQLSSPVRASPAETPASSHPVPPAEIPQAQPSELFSQEAPFATATAVSNRPSVSWRAVVFLGWVAGVLIISVLLIRRVRVVKELMSQSRPAKDQLLDLLNRCRRQIDVRGDVKLRLSGSISSPAVCGLFRPVVLVPAALV